MVISEVEQQIAICAACNVHIKDRYLFEVTNRKWHCICLRCTHCKCPLTEKCWFRQNNLYCKDDYYKLFFSCNTCKQVIERDTYVRKTSNMIFHLQCFQCNQCGKVLDSGDHYIVNDDKLLCSNHYPNLLSLSNSKNSSTELITDQEGEIVVKTEQSNLNTNSIDNQPGHFTVTNNSSHQPKFASLTPPISIMDNHPTMSNNLPHSPFLLTNHHRQTPVSTSATNLPTSNSLIHHNHPSHQQTDDRLSLSLIDYPSHHQPSSLIGNKTGLNLNEFDSSAADFYSNQSSTACYVHPSNAQLNSLPAHNSHNLINSIYEQDALRFYNSNSVTAAGCIQQTMSAPTPNSPLNEIENTHTSPSNGNSARKGRPRKRKPIGLSSSNNTGVDAISTALHEQNLNNLNSSTSSGIGSSLVSSINSGHLRNSSNSNTSSSSSSGNHQRTKRMRTSFKHSQLKMMKSYFLKNQNPDAKDLKGLAQETNLAKRVLQVWFQNQRAKYRRNNPNNKMVDGTFNHQLQLNQTCLDSPDNGSTRQFSTPSPASIISNNSILNNQPNTMQCETSLPNSSSSLDRYSPSNSILLRQTPPLSIKMQHPNSPSTNHLVPTTLHFGHLTNSHSSNGLVVNSIPNCHFNSEPIMSTFQDLY